MHVCEMMNKGLFVFSANLLNFQKGEVINYCIGSHATITILRVALSTSEIIQCILISGQLTMSKYFGTICSNSFDVLQEILEVFSKTQFP